MAADLPDRYVTLGLSLDRLQRGIVDAYTGDPAVRARVEAAPRPDPVHLHRDALDLRSELPVADLTPERMAFLDGQLAGLAVNARLLAGQRIGFVEQVQECFQVTPQPGDVASYADAHRALAALLPGTGPVAERYAAYRSATAVPADLLPDAVPALSALLRARTRAAVALPVAERVDYEIVTGQSWAGFNYFLGDDHSRVAINADLPIGLGALLTLIAHESYPGHHTERCRKQLRGDLPEHRIWLVNTPENLISEGLADLALTGVGLDVGWGALLSEAYDDLAIAYDGELGEQVAAAAAPLGRVRQDAALLMHDRGRPVEEAVAHLERWALHTPDRAAKAIEFLTLPLWSAYIATYVEGAALVRSWLDAGEGTQRQRFARLLDEPLTPAALAADVHLADGVSRP